jgi:hypothetical protein
MPLSQFDVVNLNRSMSDLGDTFRQRRLDKQKEEEDMRRELLAKEIADTNAARQNRGLDIEQRRLQVEQDRAKQQDTQSQLQEKQNLLKTIMTLNATGQIDDLGSVNDWLSNDPHFSQMGIQLKAPTQKTAPNVGQSAAAQALLEAKRWRDEGNNDYADLLEKVVKKEGEGREANPGYQTTTVKPALDPLGKPTGQNLTNTTTRVPLSQVAPPAGRLPTPMDHVVPQPLVKPAGKVRMINPAGVAGMVPADQVEAATSQGYKLAPQ